MKQEGRRNPALLPWGSASQAAGVPYSAEQRDRAGRAGHRPVALGSVALSFGRAKFGLMDSLIGPREARSDSQASLEAKLEPFLFWLDREARKG